jgi:hypothetical protein
LYGIPRIKSLFNSIKNICACAAPETLHEAHFHVQQLV